jgi:5'(3')-deoxyribonucleotidase
MKFDKKVNTVYLDLDGVLADFDKYVLTHMGRTFSHTDGPKDSTMWDFLLKVPHFYLQLEPTPYAQRLVDLVGLYANNIEILTAIPRRANMPNAEQDKIDWVDKTFDEPLKVNIGPYSGDKWKHAKPGDILIDDRPDNINDWITKGAGIGILHTYGDFDGTREQFIRAVMDFR